MIFYLRYKCLCFLCTPSEKIILCFLDLGNGWAITTLRSAEQKDFIKAAMIYVDETNWTYYIGGSNYNSAENNDVTPFRYCASDFSIADPGNIIQLFSIINTIIFD